MSDFLSDNLIIIIGSSFIFVIIVTIIIVVICKKTSLCIKNKKKKTHNEPDINSNTIEDIQEEDIEVYLSSASKNKTTTNNETIKFEFNRSKTEVKEEKEYTLQRKQKRIKSKDKIKNGITKCETFNYSSDKQLCSHRNSRKNINTSYEKNIINKNNSFKTEEDRPIKSTTPKKSSVISTSFSSIDVPDENYMKYHKTETMINMKANKAKKVLFNKTKKRKKLITTSYTKTNKIKK